VSITCICGLAGQAAAAPMGRSVRSLSREAADCRRCDLWQGATQTVFGEGPADATVVMVGEQPGDREDREGRPFVGPAGRVLDVALEAAGIGRETVYVTNVVKHFRFELRGKRRIHKTPAGWQVTACEPWFWAELDALRPKVVVLLGAVAGKAVMGRDFRVTAEHGRPLAGPRGTTVVGTIHPSAVLRAGGNRKRRMGELVSDLRVVAGLLERTA
jgi:uracil-DNA glycosylase